MKNEKLKMQNAKFTEMESVNGIQITVSGPLPAQTTLMEIMGRRGLRIGGSSAKATRGFGVNPIRRNPGKSK